jgi:hypothetical protein
MPEDDNLHWYIKMWTCFDSLFFSARFK